jgi:hypothetical protein
MKKAAFKFDGFVKRPISALRCGPRRCGVPGVRLTPRALQALISDVLRNRLNQGIVTNSSMQIYTMPDRAPAKVTAFF